MLVYEVKYWDNQAKRSVSEEFDREDEARFYAQVMFGEHEVSQVEVITWSKEPNLPRCKPDMVYRSCSMSIYKSDGWWGATIHSPRCELYRE